MAPSLKLKMSGDSLLEQNHKQAVSLVRTASRTLQEQNELSPVEDMVQKLMNI